MANNRNISVLQNVDIVGEQGLLDVDLEVSRGNVGIDELAVVLDVAIALPDVLPRRRVSQDHHWERKSETGVRAGKCSRGIQ